MTPEMKLAQMLSSDADQELVKSEMREKSVEELTAILKKEAGVGKNLALAGVGAAAGGLALKGAFGQTAQTSAKGAKQALTGTKQASSEPEVNDTVNRKAQRVIEKEEKLSPEAKLKQADAWGRDLAQKTAGLKSFVTKHVADAGEEVGKKLLKRHAGKAVGAAAGLTGAVGGSAYLGAKAGSKKKEAGAKEQLMGLVAKHKGPAMEAARKVGTKIHAGVSAAGKRLSNINDPITRGAAGGAVIGGVSGAATGMISPDRDEFGRPQRIKSMMRKGMSGGVGGAASGSLIGAMQKSSSVKALEAGLVKHALGMAGIGSMAKNFVAAAKPVAQKAMGAVKPMAQKALGGFNKLTPLGKSTAVGGALGAAKGLVAPGTNAQGQQKSRIGGMMRGAVGGAATGAAVNSISKGLSGLKPAM